jgi:hypothetical protein
MAIRNPRAGLRREALSPISGSRYLQQPFDMDDGGVGTNGTQAGGSGLGALFGMKKANDPSSDLAS